MSLLSVDHVSRTYHAGDAAVAAVCDVSLEIARGEFVAVVGPSGCGKSTLLHLCGAMERPSAGRIWLDGSRLDTLADDGLTRVRRERLGFVFQFFNLLPTLSLLENIALPLLLAGGARDASLARARPVGRRAGPGASARPSAVAVVRRRDAAGGHRARRRARPGAGHRR